MAFSTKPSLHTFGPHGFQEVDVLDGKNFTLFRQWVKQPPLFRLSPVLVLALVLFIAVVVLWLADVEPAWVVAVAAIGLVAIFFVHEALRRRAFSFNSLIVAKDFVVWQTHCSQNWSQLYRRGFQFRQLDLPFRLQASPLVVPLAEISDWTVQEDTPADQGSVAAPAFRVVLWRANSPLPTLLAGSQERAMTVKAGIQAAIQRNRASANEAAAAD